MEPNHRILIAFGTRPEWIKIKPVLDHLDRSNYELLFTGQQVDLIRDIKVDHRIHIQTGRNRLNDIIASCLNKFPETKANKVLVQGDTASAYGIALAAFNNKKQIIYLEAGLRTYDFDNPFPEEAYRQMIARIADVNLCPTELSKLNLLNEKVKGNIQVVGNTVLDNLWPHKNKAYYDKHVLVTLHRRENHDKIVDWFTALEKVANEFSSLQFIFPIHPNPRVKQYKDLLKQVKVVAPLVHSDFLKLMSSARFIITDSGGLQEEGAFLNKRIIVCRTITERPEGIDTGHLILCKEASELEPKVNEINQNFEINQPCPFGDGFSGARVAQIIRSVSLFK